MKNKLAIILTIVTYMYTMKETHISKINHIETKQLNTP
jgi:hypothetical protein